MLGIFYELFLLHASLAIYWQGRGADLDLTTHLSSKLLTRLPAIKQLSVSASHSVTLARRDTLSAVAPGPALQHAWQPCVRSLLSRPRGQNGCLTSWRTTRLLARSQHWIKLFRLRIRRAEWVFIQSRSKLRLLIKVYSLPENIELMEFVYHKFCMRFNAEPFAQPSLMPAFVIAFSRASRHLAAKHGAQSAVCIARLLLVGASSAKPWWPSRRLLLFLLRLSHSFSPKHADQKLLQASFEQIGELHGLGCSANARFVATNILNDLSHGVKWVFANKTLVKRDGLHQMWA